MLLKLLRMRPTNVVKIICALILGFWLFSASNAQPSSPISSGEPEDPISVDPDPVPLSGLEILLFSGLSFGAYSRFRKRKE